VIPDGPDAPGVLSPNDAADNEFITDVNNILKDYIDAMERVKLRLGLQTVMLLSNRGNLYLQASGLNKALMTSDPSRCAQVVTRAINLIYILSALIEPFMPETAGAILVQLNAPARTVPEAFAIDILAGHTLGTPDHLFKKIDEKMEEVWREKFGGAKAEPKLDADATHVAPGMSKRKAAAAKKAAAKQEDNAPKSAEVLAWEQRVTEQGTIVRELKAKPKSAEVDAEIATALDELKKRKAQLAEIIANEKAAS
jgi:methionyl-tRNA synthetase